MGKIEKASKRREGSATSGIRERKDSARRPAAFPIVSTDQEPGTDMFFQENFPVKKLSINSL